MAVEAATVLGKTHSEILRLLQVIQAGSLALGQVLYARLGHRALQLGGNRRAPGA
jgi:hypothetical protein